MKTIHLEANGTSLVANKEDTVDLVAGCHGYYELSFDLSNDFVGCKIVCEFTSGKSKPEFAPIIKGACLVPDDMADRPNYKVRLIARKNDFQILTCKALIEQRGGTDAN